MILRRTLLTAALATAFSASLPARADMAKPVNVTVAIPPLASIVKAIGGDHVAVTVMVKPGVSPKVFEPTPMQMAALESADLYLSMGLPPEMNWTPQVAAARPDMPLLTMTKLVKTRMMGKAGGKQKPDPHVWLGPDQLRSIAVVVRDALSKQAPAHASVFAVNTQAWIARLDKADAEAKARLDPYKGRAMLVYHPAFGYMAQAYGLRQIAIEERGMPPGPRIVAKAIQVARAENLKAIFVQAQFSEDEARTVASEIGGKVVRLNPLHPDPIVTITKASQALEASFK